MCFAPFMEVLHQQHKDSLSMTLCEEPILLILKIVLRDQDKALVPNKVCTSCVETLRSWSHGKDKHLPFGISKIWREQVDHVADRYL